MRALALIIACSSIAPDLLSERYGFSLDHILKPVADLQHVVSQQSIGKWHVLFRLRKETGEKGYVQQQVWYPISNAATGVEVHVATSESSTEHLNE